MSSISTCWPNACSRHALAEGGGRGRGRPVWLFRSEHRAAAALVAAAEPAAGIDAIVSRGGRPDLAGSRLAAVRAPTLLLVGGHDPVVLELSRRAQAALTCENRLAIVPGATHLFEEPGPWKRWPRKPAIGSPDIWRHWSRPARDRPRGPAMSGDRPVLTWNPAVTFAPEGPVDLSTAGLVP